jgi:uncharacterized Rmd1/YagE family protein
MRMMKLEALAYHLESKIDLKVIRKKNKALLIKYEHSFLLYQLTEDSFVYFKDYGSVVFINCNEEIKRELFKFTAIDEKWILQLPIEIYNIIIDADKELGVEFDQITVANLTTDIAHIIMLNLAQSVALDNYYNLSFSLLENIKIYSSQLESSGKINLTRNRMRKFIGRTMNLKNRIAENLFIFDSSSLAWSTASLSELDHKLAKELDIINRHHGLQDNLTIVKENLDLFKDILQHRYSSILEWIIILLILFEVIQLLIEKLL